MQVSQNNNLDTCHTLPSLFIIACFLFDGVGGLFGYNDKITDNIPTIEECLSLCKNESDFICRSVEYYVSGGNHERCSISADNYASAGVFSQIINDYLKFWELCEYL